MSAPYSPGPLQQAQADRVEADDEQRTALRGPTLASASTSSRQPKKFGCCTTTHSRLVVDGLLQVVGIEEAVRRRQRDDLRHPGWRGRSRASGDTRDGRSRRRAPCRVRPVTVDGHQHGLGHGAAAVVEAGVGDVHAGQLADERLILEERLQAALAGLGLVGRVGRVELAAAGEASTTAGMKWS